MRAAIALSLSLIAGAASANDWKPVQAAGKWTYLATIDGFTDKKKCRIVYDGDHEIQLASDTLAFGGYKRSVLKAYQFRIDSGEPINRTPNEIESDIGVVFFEAEVLQKILDSKRLRIKIETNYGAGSAFHDLEMAGAQGLVVKLRAECPGS